MAASTRAAVLGSTETFRFCIDRGGTFTNIHTELPGRREGYENEASLRRPVQLRVYDDAPIEGIRRILEEFSGEKI
uniref:Hydantoinase/oxoprolinase N-terminal domain-containing protein n=1 Tax=Oryza sativa subsp. japonica TaxID=39947 RepID=Q6YSV1_ORYSJ|nr:hypothetical protein [Oryza sativa Japonica Group]